ncbi:hypothetical protein SMICM304S_11780 [Streptomyces microflavus]
MTEPDVTVVVAVYNTMPYLTECLNSLVGQSIGVERLQVIAVDDGSTDDSGPELDRFAERYPGTVTVLHQENSGGPAAPGNRALELATGRFVYFIGSDDYLGEEALERMVACADANESDVVIGKMVGTNGRYVHQKLYTGDRPEVSLYDSELPYTLANTKLFRRELVEKHGLRFPEDLPVGSDQPFTIEACVRARRISVLSDYTYYYAVKRGDSSNITYRADHLARLRCTARIMEHTAGLIPAGPGATPCSSGTSTGSSPSSCRRTSPLSTSPPAARSARASARCWTRTSRTSCATARGSSAGCGSASPGAVPSTSSPAPSRTRRTKGRRPSSWRGTGPSRSTPDSGTPGSVSTTCGTRRGRRSRAGSPPVTKLESAAWEQNGEDLGLALKLRIGVTGDTSSAVVALAQGALPASADKPGARESQEDSAPGGAR